MTPSPSPASADTRGPALAATVTGAGFTPLDGPAATVLAHSITSDGVEVVTFETVMHRFILSENNTHKAVAKCAGSSRAVPVAKQIEMLRANPAFPVRWASEQPGMQGGDGLSIEQQTLARYRWRQMLEASIKTALDLRELGLHKSLTNRLLEPFSWIRVVQTATAWDNFLDLRDHPEAQPEFAALARLMREARDASTPTLLAEGEWHLPYVADRDRIEVTERLDAGDPRLTCRGVDANRLLAQVSSARCARTSYLTNPRVNADGVVVEQAGIDIDKDLALHDRLVGAQPRHWSPLEHQATPWAENRQSEPLGFFDSAGRLISVFTDHLPRIGNLVGMRSLRTETEAILGEITFR